MTAPQRQRFVTEDLDPDDPFEIDDGNRAHLFKHGFSPPDLYDLWFSSDLVFFPAREDGEADWLLVGILPGNVQVCAPLASPDSGRLDQCRPIGLYLAPARLAKHYMDAIREGDDDE